MTATLRVGDCEVIAEVSGGGFASARATENGVRSTIEITATGLSTDSILLLTWSVPNRDGVAAWTARTEAERWLPVSFSAPWSVSALTSSPIGALYAADDHNRLTFALSETLSAFDLRTGVSGASARFFGTATFGASAWQDRADYVVSLSLDVADAPIAQTLDAALRWWALSLPAQLEAPEVARIAMYSTWYSLGQTFDSGTIERQAELASAAGCGSIIVDDGWQTADRVGGYASCGDWDPDPDAFPAMASHVARVRALGVSYLLWFALPFVGSRSEAFTRFEPMMLGYRADLDTWVLDPRFPEVRAHLIDRIVRSVREWGIDGVKIDFIDAFAMPAPAPAAATDIGSVQDAVVRLLDDLTSELTAIRPDVMIEFRQTYVGPRLRSFANMLRVTDCAMDSTENRVHSLDLRLIAGATVVHSDMVMWHPEASPEVAARQLLDVLFCVPQISMRLDELSASHREMLRFWLSVFARYRTVLLGGRLSPSRADLSYPRVRADDDWTTFLALYDAPLAQLDEPPAQTIVLVNATVSDRVVLCASSYAGEHDLLVRDCLGHEHNRGSVTVSEQPVILAIPPSGLAVLTRRPVH
ncbi:glycoside hydrolase family 36 protein [Microbacterium sp.]|uniref:glycoside hydrolase family 36 protein n=1 Tax=Microbacterium sp. TaxID=51671 RepID=UPI003F7026E3